MRQLPENQETAVKPNAYRIKELIISYEPLSYKITISIGVLADEVFKEVTEVKLLEMSATLISQILLDAEAANKLGEKTHKQG